MALLLSLCTKGSAVHRANTCKVKNFIMSFGNRAKTDNLDAQALAYYGYERHEKLALFKIPSKKALDLYELVGRRNDLTQMLRAEKNRLAGPKANIIKASCTKMIETISAQIESIAKEIDILLTLRKIVKISIICIKSRENKELKYG